MFNHGISSLNTVYMYLCLSDSCMNLTITVAVHIQSASVYYWYFWNEEMKQFSCMCNIMNMTK